MTAEIAIMNQQGIALAADSAVTIGSVNAPKIYPSANKVFMLSKYYPVGIMIFSNANFMGIHWETLIKMYRKNLSNKKFDTIKEYGEDFLSFISESKDIFTEELQRTINREEIQHFYNHIYSRINKKLLKTLKESSNDLSKEQIRKLIEIVIDYEYNKLKEYNNIVDIHHKELDQQNIKKIQSSYKDDILKLKKDIFKDLGLTRNASTKLTLIGKMLLVKIGVSDSSTGIVIAGYGEREIFPHLTYYNLESIICNNLKYIHRDTVGISLNNQALIIPFAQSDMVYTFVEGIDKDYLHQLKLVAKTTFDSFFDAFTDGKNGFIDNDKDKQLLKKIINGIYKDYTKEIDSIRRANFVDPLLDIIVSLPKTELANMAETMVNLTSFKRKMSKDAETVGGPIDVALISKSDGFVWIRRKHYFKAELNQHFFANYYKGDDVDE